MDKNKNKRIGLVVAIGVLFILGAVVFIPNEIIPADKVEERIVLDEDGERNLYGRGDKRWIAEGGCTADYIRITVEPNSTIDDVNAALSDFGRKATIRKDRAVRPVGQYFGITLKDIDSFAELDSLLEGLRGVEDSKIRGGTLYNYCPPTPGS